MTIFVGLPMIEKAKHKIRIPDGFYEYFNKEYLKSIRSQVLQKLVFLLFLLNFPDSFLRKEIEQRLVEEYRKRLKENKNVRPLRPTFDNLVYFLRIEDVCEILGCSERTAREYLDALYAIVSVVEHLGV